MIGSPLFLFDEAALHLLALGVQYAADALALAVAVAAAGTAILIEVLR